MYTRTHHVPVALDAREVRRIDEQGVDAGEPIQVVRRRRGITVEVRRTAAGARRNGSLAVCLASVQQLAGLSVSQ